MSLEGLKLAALYSYDCRKARMLNINGLLSDFIRNEENQEKTTELLRKLASFEWYSLIAKNMDIGDPFSERVIRSYWTGNDSIQQIEAEKRILFLFHNFTVLSSPMMDLASQDECKVSWGMITEVTGDKLVVDYEPLVLEDGKFALGEGTIEIGKGFLKEPKVNDWISFHFNLGREKLTEEQVLLLHGKTEEVIRIFNEQK